MPDIVYPRQNPLSNINPNTTGSPMIVVPASHITIAKIILLFIESITKFAVSNFSIFLNF